MATLLTAFHELSIAQMQFLLGRLSKAFYYYRGEATNFRGINQLDTGYNSVCLCFLPEFCACLFVCYETVVRHAVTVLKLTDRTDPTSGGNETKLEPGPSPRPNSRLEEEQ